MPAAGRQAPDPEAGGSPPLLLAATRNRHKTAEIAAILAGLPLRVAGAEVLPRVPDPAETGATFEENARLKAVAFARAALELPPAARPRWALADDSGLCVDALGDAPGVRSARYAAAPGGGNAGDAANNRKLLGELRGAPAERRGARFVCAAALAAVPGAGGGEPEVVLAARGECRGRILEEPRGAGGFGYDPLFLVPELGLSFAELPEGEKNRISHRARALARVRAWLEEELARGVGR